MSAPPSLVFHLQALNERLGAFQHSLNGEIFGFIELVLALPLDVGFVGAGGRSTTVNSEAAVLRCWRYLQRRVVTTIMIIIIVGVVIAEYGVIVTWRTTDGGSAWAAAAAICPSHDLEVLRPQARERVVFELAAVVGGLRFPW